MDKTVLSVCIKLYRSNRDLSIRECAKEVGVSVATMSRIENGKPCDSSTFVKLLNWLTKKEKAVSNPKIERL